MATKAITAHTLKTQLGRVLREVRENERFVVLRRNLPVAVVQSVQDYVKDHSDEYEDVQDFIDTMMEEADPEFQGSLKRSARQVKRGDYLTHSELKLALANKKFR
jgi:prevent-host-death family protein